MDPWNGPPCPPVPATSECIHCWEEFHGHLCVSNPTVLISNGDGFIEVSWYQQNDFTYAGSMPSGPPPQPRVSPQPDLAPSPVDPPGQSPIATGIQTVTPNQLSPPPHSPRQRPPQPPRAPRARPRRSPAPHLPPLPPTEPTRMSPPPLSDEDARQILETWIRNSDWFRQGEMEPVVGGPGVPTCALQLAAKSQSVYCCFLIPVLGRKGKLRGWKSATDPAWKPDRHQRALGRERGSRNHLPFKCPRDPDHDPDCDFKGFSKENLSDHLARRNEPLPCTQCSKSIAFKNMRRHVQSVHRQ